jgi:hypothetical protein
MNRRKLNIRTMEEEMGANSSMGQSMLKGCL